MINQLNKKIFIFIFLGIVAIALLFIKFNNVQRISQPTPSIPTIPTATPVKIQTTVIPEKTGVGIETEGFKQGQLDFARDHPILQKLPFGNPFFSIEYLSETHLIVHAKTRDQTRDYQEAKKWFIENSIDTSKVVVEYK